MKTECDYLYGWILKNGHIRKISPKMVNPSDLAGNAEEEKFLVIEDFFNVITGLFRVTERLCYIV